MSPLVRTLVASGLSFGLLTGQLVGSQAWAGETTTTGSATCRNTDLPARARCGLLQVPLSRTDPAAGNISVAYALVPRRDTSRPSLGTLVPNPGGPGASTINEAATYLELLAPLMDRRDLLLVDPRGTGASSPLRCGVDTLPVTSLTAAAITKTCGKALGSRIGMYGSAAVADDIDDVRAFLGLDRLDLWGESYGSYLMTVYGSRHGEHVQLVVLSGAYPIHFDQWGRDRLAAARQAIAHLCQRSSACSTHVVLDDIAALAAELRTHPVHFSALLGQRRLPLLLDEKALASLVYATGDGDTLGLLPGALAAGRAGDLAELERMVRDQLVLMIEISRYPGFSFGALVAASCHDYPRAFSYADPYAARKADYERARSAVPASAFSPFSAAAWTGAGFEGTEDCLAWPNDPTAAAPIPSGTLALKAPVLVLSGDLDANTPNAAGRQAAAQFAHSTFAVVPNAGHTPTSFSECAAELALRFVATRSADARACNGTGTPPPVAGRPALLTAQLPQVEGRMSPSVRRAISLLTASIADVEQDSHGLRDLGGIGGLRGGRISMADGTLRLSGDKIVTDATVTGTLTRTAHTVTLVATLYGRGAAGNLTVRIADTGLGQASGTVGKARVNIAFALPG